MGIIVAIDGPVASGKGTIAPVLAKRLKGFYLYTGGMYRSLALACIEEKTDIKNEKEVLKVLSFVEINLHEEKVFLNERDVTERLKEADVVEAVPIVSSYTKVRQEMVKKQREAGIHEVEQGETVVAEGRDVATKIFPEADFKLFLTAKVEVRARRRLAQIRESGGKASYEEILQGMQLRDRLDTEREEGPLLSNPEKHGYFVLDNSNLSEEETINAIIEEIKRRSLLNGSN